MRINSGRWPASFAGAAVALLACSDVTELEAPTLAAIVARDGIPFAHDAVPVDVVEMLAGAQVVVVGETHFLREHREFVASLLGSLHARGYRQVLMEWPHAYDWVLNDFATDGEAMPGWVPPVHLGALLIEWIRDFNRALPVEERIRLGALDVNLDEYGGAEMFVGSLRSLSASLGDSGPIAEFLAGPYAGSDRQREALEELLAQLASETATWVEAWGEERYRTVLEMAEVELVSVPVRALRADRYDVSTRLREEAIKRIVDRRVGEVAGGTLINIGSTHAQKLPLFGTDAEWLGDYLVHESIVAGGSVQVLDVSPARVRPASGGPVENPLAIAPENELFRTVHETWPDLAVFLPLDDPVFEREEVPAVFNGAVYTTALGRVYDAVVVLPLAHRDILP